MANNSRKLQAVREPVEVQRKTVLGFRYEGGLYVGTSERGAFKPCGLMIWGAPEGATLRMATIALDEQVLQSMDGVPAKFFALGLSFDHVSQLVEEGVEPPAWVDWDELQAGCSVRIMLLDQAGQVLSPANGVTLAMWGVNRKRVDVAPAPAAPAASG
jgi:hypothetical protein